MDTDTPSSTPAYGLTTPQIEMLMQGLDKGRVSKNPQGLSHVEAWDVRRWLIRIFGIAGWSTELTDLTLVAEYDTTNSNGQPAITVIYRASVVLIIRDIHGNELGRYHGAATGDAPNFPTYKRGDAHDFAIKTADSQAFKRAAMNLGDQFGLSLYNKGSNERVVCTSVAYGRLTALQQPGAPKVADAPVGPEPVPQYVADAQTHSLLRGMSDDQLDSLSGEVVNDDDPTMYQAVSAEQKRRSAQTPPWPDDSVDGPSQLTDAELAAAAASGFHDVEAGAEAEMDRRQAERALRQTLPAMTDQGLRDALGDAQRAGDNRRETAIGAELARRRDRLVREQQKRPAAGCGTQLLSEALQTADRPPTPTGTVQERSAAHPERPVNVPGSVAWDVDDLLNNWGPRSDLIEAIDALVELHEQSEGAGWLAAPVPVPALLQKHEAAPPVGPLGDVLICARKHLEWRAQQ